MDEYLKYLQSPVEKLPRKFFWWIAFLYTLPSTYGIARNTFLETPPNYIVAMVILSILAVTYFVASSNSLKNQSRVIIHAVLFFVAAIALSFRNQDLGIGLLFMFGALLYLSLAWGFKTSFWLIVAASSVLFIKATLNGYESEFTLMAYFVVFMATLAVVGYIYDYVVVQNAKQLAALERKQFELDVATKESGFSAIELDIANDTVRLVIGESPNNEAFEEKRDFTEAFSVTYGTENIEKIRHLLKHPTQTLVLPAFWKTYFDHYAQLSVSMPFERDGKQYQLIYSRMVDDVLVKYHESLMDKSYIQRSIFYVATPFNRLSWRAGKTQREKDALQAAFERGEKVI